MKIAVIELDFHWDCVDGFCKTFEDSGHELIIFTKPFIYNKIKHNTYVKKYTWIFSDRMSKTRFLKRSIEKINDADIIFIDTIASEFGAYVKAGFKKITISRTHNAYKLLDPWRHIQIFPTPFYVWKAFSYMVREIILKGFWYYRPLLLKKIDFFVFPDEGITRYVKSQGWLPEKKILPSFPMKIYEPGIPDISHEEEEFRISIIGSVDKRRRDYHPVIEAFRLLVPHLKRRLVLTLLGKATGTYASGIIDRLKAIESPLFKLEYFTYLVPQQDFDRLLAKTHIIISPVTLNGSTEIFGEIYGKTKISGSLLDMLRFPRITLMPSEYTLEEDLVPFVEQYSTPEEMKMILAHYIDNATEFEIKSKLLKNFISEKYNRKSVADHFLNIVSCLKK